MTNHAKQLNAYKALQSIPADLQYQDWIRVGMAAKAAGLSFEDFDEWSSWAANYDKRAAISAWRSFKIGRGVTAGTLFYVAAQYGWRRDPMNRTSIPASMCRSTTRSTCQHERQDQDVKWQRIKNSISRVWEQSQKLSSGTAVARYLAKRGISLPPTPSIRYMPKLSYWHDGAKRGSYPSMLCAVTNATNELIAIHRTYLTSEGEKAPVPQSKKLTPVAGSLRGATIKISEPALHQGRVRLGVAEGVETALSASAIFNVPVWSALSATGLISFIPPTNVHDIYIFADNDKNDTGQHAASTLANRLTQSGYVVRVHIPECIGDWNDVLLQARGQS